MSGESEKTLRDTFDEAKVSFLHNLRLVVRLKLTCAEASTLPALSGRGRRHYA
jgi:hypothetical protein